MLKFYYVYSTRRVTRNSTLFTEHSVRLYLLKDGDLKHVYDMTDMFTGEMQLVVDAAHRAGALPPEAYTGSADTSPDSPGRLERRGVAKFTSL